MIRDGTGRAAGRPQRTDGVWPLCLNTGRRPRGSRARPLTPSRTNAAMSLSSRSSPAGASRSRPSPAVRSAGRTLVSRPPPLARSDTRAMVSKKDTKQIKADPLHGDPPPAGYASIPAPRAQPFGPRFKLPCCNSVVWCCPGDGADGLFWLPVIAQEEEAKEQKKPGIDFAGVKQLIMMVSMEVGPLTPLPRALPQRRSAPTRQSL